MHTLRQQRVFTRVKEIEVAQPWIKSAALKGRL
jgi:hypothetical protein